MLGADHERALLEFALVETRVHLAEPRKGKIDDTEFAINQDKNCC